MLYHVSHTAGLKTLLPRRSSHQKPYVYAIENMVTGLLFGAKHDDFDFIIDADEHGTPIIWECYPGALQTVFQGKSCSVYEVEDSGFQRGVTSWDPELVCGHEVAVLNEIAVSDLYQRLLEEEENGRLVVCRYEFQDEFQKTVADHIVDRIFRSELDLATCMEQDERFATHYRKLVQALRSVLDGHLLP